MSWNYRVIEFVDPEQGPWRAVHEVFYDDRDVPISYAEEPAQLVSYDDEGQQRALEWILDRMREALDRPLLVEGDFKRSTAGSVRVLAEATD